MDYNKQLSSETTSEKIINKIDSYSLLIGGVLVAVLSVVVTYIVFSRYVLSLTPRWSEEIPRLILIWLTFIGTISGFARNGHFNAGILKFLIPKGRFYKNINLFCRFLVFLSTAFFLIILIYSGVQLTNFTWSHQSTALSLPIGLFYIALPISCLLSLIIMILGWKK